MLGGLLWALIGGTKLPQLIVDANTDRGCNSRVVDEVYGVGLKVVEGEANGG